MRLIPSHRLTRRWVVSPPMNSSTPNLDDLRPSPPPPPPVEPKRSTLRNTHTGPRRPRLDPTRVQSLQRTIDFLSALSTRLAPLSRHARNDIRIFRADLDDTLHYLNAALTHKGKAATPPKRTDYATYLLTTCLPTSALLPPTISKTSRIRSRSHPHS